MIDPFGALATFVLGRLKQAAIAQWAKLLFEIWFSATVTFLLICGGTLIKTRSASLAIGSGMFVSALVMVYFFRSSELTKGMRIVLPAEEATAELAQAFQTISKEK